MVPTVEEITFSVRLLRLIADMAICQFLLFTIVSTFTAAGIHPRAQFNFNTSSPIKVQFVRYGFWQVIIKLL